MKTLKLNKKVIRVADNETGRWIAMGYKYCPKSEWKSLTRVTKKDKLKEVAETVTGEKGKVKAKVRNKQNKIRK